MKFILSPSLPESIIFIFCTSGLYVVITLVIVVISGAVIVVTGVLLSFTEPDAPNSTAISLASLFILNVPVLATSPSTTIL